MKVFWRTEPLTEPEQKLLNLCLEAHAQSVHRDNISTVTLKNAAIGSMNYTTSLCAALSTLGGTHAPILQSVMALIEPMENIKRVIEMGGKIPGWGSSFEKEGIDPIWAPLADLLAKEFPEMHGKIEEITQELQRHGKMLWPNPSIHTAATGIVLRIPGPIIPWLFVHGRLLSWTAIFYNTITMKNPTTTKEGAD